MRILLSCYAEKTGFFSMAPLAWALRTAGHEVRVASQPELVDAITEAGLPAVSVGRDHSLWRVLAAQGLARGNPVAPLDQAALPEEEVSWEYLRDGFRQVVPWWFRLVNEPMVDDLVDFCRAWRPDLVLWDPRTFAAPVAAEAVGAAHARLTWGMDFYGRARRMFTDRLGQLPEQDREDPLADWLSRVAERHGVAFDETMTHGHFTIDQLPDPLRIRARGLHYLSMRHIPYNGRSVTPPWLWAPPERPRVCLTLGVSAMGRAYGYSVSVGELVESLAELDAEIVATVAEKEQDALGTLPDNVRVESFVPLHALLPHCDAVVHHGGFGSTFTAIASGTPQVAIPQQFDAQAIAPRIAAQGAGIHLTTAQATGDRVRDAVTRLLTDPAHTASAGSLRRAAEALPSPGALVPAIETAVSRYTAVAPHA